MKTRLSLFNPWAFIVKNFQRKTDLSTMYWRRKFKKCNQ